MLSNAMAYNPPGEPTHKNAIQLWNFFEEIWRVEKDEIASKKGKRRTIVPNPKYAGGAFTEASPPPPELLPAKSGTPRATDVTMSEAEPTTDVKTKEAEPSQPTTDVTTKEAEPTTDANSTEVEPSTDAVTTQVEHSTDVTMTDAEPTTDAASTETAEPNLV